MLFSLGCASSPAWLYQGCVRSELRVEFNRVFCVEVARLVVILRQDTPVVGSFALPRHLSLYLSLLILVLEVMYTPLELPVLFPETEHVSEDHVLDGLELTLTFDPIESFLELIWYQVGQEVDAGPIGLTYQIQTISQVLVLDHQLEVCLHCIFVLL